MSLSLDFRSLRLAYRDGDATPVSVIREVLSRIGESGEDRVWIERVPDNVLLAQATMLEQRRAAADMPLYGIPFAVKDNIDVAGMPTTAACPGFADTPERSAPVVERLLAAGALLVGKTNLDQFATGLVGVRSPYGVPRNPFDPAYIPGGSSSGSAVAVAAGLVGFALGTDTAGSGRVPAGFNNVVGLKPTRGLISTRGVVPACRSLDCVSVFALTVADAAAVLDVARGLDAEDGYSRTAPAGFAAMGTLPPQFAFGVPRPDQLDFFGNGDAARLFDDAVARLEALGGRAVTVDFAPFLEVAALLYDGPWVAERTAAVAGILMERPEILHPVTRRIVAGGASIPAIDAFRGQYRLAGLRRRIEPVWNEIDMLLVPTSGTIYRVDDVEAEPIALNSNLGRYTNFTNLLDLSALAVPNGFQRNGLPAGVTLLAPAFHDPLLAAVGAAFHARTGLMLGATGAPLPRISEEAVEKTAIGCFPSVPLAVVGAHLSGQPLNRELLALGARLRRASRTAPRYRLYALPDGKRPGLIRAADDGAGTGAAIEIEVWDVPSSAVGAFLAGIAPPLCLGTLELEDGSAVKGFLCEAWAVAEGAGARDITAFGGWRAFRNACT